VSPGRNEQRKAATRAKIVRGANELFHIRGYAATSMEDIAQAADVAIRTIYLHFDSKAAIFLAFHDEWLADFVRLVGERTADETVADAVTRALDGMPDAEWGADRRIENVEARPPVLEFIGGGSPEIAGHMLQRWVAAQDELTVRFRELSGAPLDSPAPRIEAAAVFAAWLTSILDFRERFAHGRLPGGSSYEVGRAAIRAYVAGLG